VAGLSFAFVVPAGAGAVPPESVVIEDIHIEQLDSSSCDFPFLEVFDGRVTITTFFDEDANPTRVTFQLPFHGTLTNETTGESVSVDQVLQETDDLEAGTVSFVGLRFRVTFPGLGVVLLDAGKIVFDADGNAVFEAGPPSGLQRGFHRVLRGLRLVACGAVSSAPASLLLDETGIPRRITQCRVQCSVGRGPAAGTQLPAAGLAAVRRAASCGRGPSGRGGRGLCR
jgi:hypothetical protein